MSVDYLACAVLMAWLALTVVKYVRPAWSPKALGLGGVLSELQLIHRWVLFSQAPVDYRRVFYRTVDGAGHASMWLELSLIAPRGWKEMVWYPQRRSARMFFRAQRALGNLCEKGVDRDAIELSLPFLRLLNLVSSAVRADAATPAAHCQILLTETAPDNTTRLVLRSGLHRLEADR